MTGNPNRRPKNAFRSDPRMVCTNPAGGRVRMVDFALMPDDVFCSQILYQSEGILVILSCDPPPACRSGTGPSVTECRRTFCLSFPRMGQGLGHTPHTTCWRAKRSTLPPHRDAIRTEKGFNHEGQ